MMRLRVCLELIASLRRVALLVLLLTPQCVSSLMKDNFEGQPHLRRTQFTYTINNEHDETYQSPPRVILEPFRLSLSKFDSLLSEKNREVLLSTMETVATNFLRTRTTTPALEYVKFGGIEQELESDALDVEVDVGVASYAEYPTPSEAQVRQWVSEALTYNLVPTLQGIPAFSTVETADFVLQRERPASVTEPTAGGPDPFSSTAETDTKAIESPDTDRRSGRRTAMWSVLGVALAMALMGTLFLGVAYMRRRERQEVRILDEVQPDAAPPMDVRSVADSESEWTVATEAGDSMAIKSIHPATGLVVTSPVTSALVMSESFERERQVAISKDMLTGKWSGNLTNPRGTAGTGASESVLQPSHFTAATEQRDREARATTPSSPRLVPDLEASSMETSSTSTDGSKERTTPDPGNDDGGKDNGSNPT